MLTKINNYITNYFEQTLLESLCPQCYLNQRLEIESFKNVSIFSNKINYYKLSLMVIILGITLLLKLPFYFYLIDLFVYYCWSFDPYFIHQGKSKIFAKFVLMSILHKFFLFNREQRSNEIISFLQNNRPNIPIDPLHRFKSPQIQLYSFRFNYLEKDSNLSDDSEFNDFLKCFNQEYSKGLLRYIKERFNNNLSKKRDIKFLLSIYLSPNKEKMSLETLQFISTIIYKELSHIQLNTQELEFDPDLPIIFFNEYTEQQLKRIFSSNFKAKDYITILKNPDIVAPIFPNFDELNTFLNKIHVDFKYKEQLQENPILQFNNNGSNYSCALVLNVNNLIKLSKVLNNCLSSKESKCVYGDYSVFEITKNNETFGAIAYDIDSKGILHFSEIKGKANTEIPEKDLIKKELKKGYAFIK